MPPQPSAVRFYAPDHPLLAANVKSVLEQHRDKFLEELLLAKDWGDYCERKGKVLGIDTAIQLTINAEQALNERN